MSMPPKSQAPELLVIDDDPDITSFIRLVAEQAGYAVVVAGSFSRFRQSFTERTKVIVVDLVMPDTDGVEVVRYLAAKKCEAAIILVSSADVRLINSVSRLARAQGLWIVAALRKPFAAGALDNVLCDIRPTVARRGEFDPAGMQEENVNPTADELREALLRNELAVLFQPKIYIQPSEVMSVEALVRWHHPRLGLLHPKSFVPLAEQSGVIDTLTEIVMTHSFAQLGEWLREGFHVNVSINLSARSLVSLDLPDRVAKVAARHSISPQQVMLEVTESWLIEDIVRALDILSRFRIKGFGLSVDDFGTGYATLQQLQDIPFSELKIDQSFIRGASDDHGARVIADSSVSLGQKLDLQVVAEGVESAEDWQMVQQLGCDMAQGYYIARPMEGNDVAAWFQDWRVSRGVEVL